MELRGQDNNIGMPISMGFNPPLPNQDPSSKLSSAPTISSLADNRRKNEVCGSAILSPTQTLENNHLLLHQHQHHMLNQPPPPPPRYPHPDPDPTQLANSTIAGSSNCKAPQPQPQQPQHAQTIASSTNSSSSILYRECLKNHAASTGGHVVDGCGEFMPSGEEGTPGALICAACDCHRNFHRRETDGEPDSGVNCYSTYNPIRSNSHRQRITIHSTQHPPSHPAPPPYYHQHHHHHQQQKYSHGLISSPPTGPVMMTFGGGGGAPAESSSEDLNLFQSNAGAQTEIHPSFSASKG